MLIWRPIATGFSTSLQNRRTSAAAIRTVATPGEEDSVRVSAGPRGREPGWTVTGAWGTGPVRVCRGSAASSEHEDPDPPLPLPIWLGIGREQRGTRRGASAN